MTLPGNFTGRGSSLRLSSHFSSRHRTDFVDVRGTTFNGFIGFRDGVVLQSQWKKKRQGREKEGEKE